jgi:hypothetical protein
MKAQIKKYVKERNEMLKKCNVKELRKFVNEHKGYYSAEYLENFNKASDEVLQVTLHKMIVNVPTLPAELREKSAFWLVLHGFSLEIN